METDHLLSDGATRSLGILLIDWPTLGHVTTPDSVSVVGGSGGLAWAGLSVYS